MGSRRRIVAWVAPPVVAAVTVTALAAGGAFSSRAVAVANGLDNTPPALATTPSTPASSPSASAPSPSATATPRPVASPKPTPKTTPKPTTARPTVPATLASRLHTLPSTTTQVVIVHAPTANTTYATLETFSKVHGAWVPQFAPMSARIGQDGFSDNHVEGSPSTPTGVYGFGSTMYGNGSDPGLRFAWHHLVTDDWWNENSGSPQYNEFVHSPTSPGGGSEALWTVMPQYEFLAFVTYNVPAVPGRGSAIFLHETDGQATHGCISLPRSDLLSVLRWLDPAAHPRIVLSPDSELSRF
jgi:L,D-peptidoglycan transpeptidase YkuD (ErfK/YbiS/YcfS/YnhG family)